MPYGFDYAQQPTGYFNTNYRPQMMQPAPQTANVNWISVNGIAGARDHIVQPGQTAWMMDNNEPIFYVKDVDNMGRANLRTFRFEEIQAGTQQPQTPQIDMSNFATKEDIAKLESQLQKIMADFGGVNV